MLPTASSKELEEILPAKSESTSQGQLERPVYPLSKRSLNLGTNGLTLTNIRGKVFRDTIDEITTDDIDRQKDSSLLFIDKEKLPKM